MTDEPIMSIDELLCRLSMGRASRPYIVSYRVYDRMEKAIEFYLASGELVEDTKYRVLVRREEITGHRATTEVE